MPAATSLDFLGALDRTKRQPYSFTSAPLTMKYAAFSPPHSPASSSSTARRKGSFSYEL